MRFSLQGKIGFLAFVAALSLLTTVVVGAVATARLNQSSSEFSEKYLSALAVLGDARNAASAANVAVFKVTNEIRAGQTEQASKEKMATVRSLLSVATQKAREADLALARCGLAVRQGSDATLSSLEVAAATYEKKLAESLDVIAVDVSVGGMMLMTTEEDFVKAAELLDRSNKVVQEAVFSRAADTSKSAKQSQIMLISFGISALVLFLGTALATVLGIRRASSLCIDFTHAVALGDLNTKVQVQNERDEFTKIVRALEKMQERLRVKAELASRIAEGDLSVDVAALSSVDTLGNALQKMRLGLIEMVESVKLSFQGVLAEMRGLSQTSESLRKTAHDQAASLEEMSSSLSEVSNRVQATTASTQNAESQAKATSTLAHSGKMKIASLEQSIEEIHSASKQVSSVIKAIDDIAFQTNLLALNASVEAARAGSHGRGFAVVAEEVRALASRSAKAAEQSTSLIEGSLRSVAAGLSMTQETTQGYQQVFTGIENVTSEMQAVSQTSSDQARELAEVTTALNHLGGITQETASLAETLSLTVTKVSEHGERLEKLLRRFRIS
jgi:methyl-accepting chemotaxis protein